MKDMLRADSVDLSKMEKKPFVAKKRGKFERLDSREIRGSRGSGGGGGGMERDWECK